MSQRRFDYNKAVLAINVEVTMLLNIGTNKGLKANQAGKPLLLGGNRFERCGLVQQSEIAFG
jgi:hypothetical protein